MKVFCFAKREEAVFLEGEGGIVGLEGEEDDEDFLLLAAAF